MITREQAYRIAAGNCGEPVYCIEFDNAWHFLTKDDMRLVSDPGIAVRRSDGAVHFGFFQAEGEARGYRVENGRFIEDDNGEEPRED